MKHTPDYNKFFLLSAVILMFCILSACGQAAGENQGNISETVTLTVTVEANPTEESTPTKVVVIKEITLDELRNMDYQLPDIAETLKLITGQEGRIKLIDGLFEQNYPDSASKLQVKLIQAVNGDITSDGAADAVVLLVVDLGGSGTFYYLVAVVDEAGDLAQTASTLLGDRVKVENIDVKDGRVIVDVIRHAPDDPMCCPTEKASLVFILQGDQLIAEGE